MLACTHAVCPCLKDTLRCHQPWPCSSQAMHACAAVSKSNALRIARPCNGQAARAGAAVHMHVCMCVCMFVCELSPGPHPKNARQRPSCDGLVQGVVRRLPHARISPPCPRHPLSPRRSCSTPPWVHPLCAKAPSPRYVVGNARLLSGCTAPNPVLLGVLRIWADARLLGMLPAPRRLRLIRWHGLSTQQAVCTLAHEGGVRSKGTVCTCSKEGARTQSIHWCMCVLVCAPCMFAHLCECVCLCVCVCARMHALVHLCGTA